MAKTVKLVPVTVAEKLTTEIIERYLRQLLSDNRTFSIDNLKKNIENKSCHLFFAMIDDVRVGMITLSILDLPSGKRGCIDDVVVDEAFRGEGYGKGLMEAVEQFAIEQGVESLFLTSNPKRIAANLLYTKCGYTPKETNVYVKLILQN